MTLNSICNGNHTDSHPICDLFVQVSFSKSFLPPLLRIFSLLIIIFCLHSLPFVTTQEARI